MEKEYRVEPLVGYRTYRIISDLETSVSLGSVSNGELVDIEYQHTRATHSQAFFEECNGLLDKRCTCGWYAIDAEAPPYGGNDGIWLVVKCELYGKVVEHEKNLDVLGIYRHSGGCTLEASIAYTPRYWRAEYFTPISAKLFVNMMMWGPSARAILLGLIRDKFGHIMDVSEAVAWHDNGLCNVKFIPVNSINGCNCKPELGVSYTVTRFNPHDLSGYWYCRDGCREQQAFRIDKDVLYKTYFGSAQVDIGGFFD